MVHVPPVRSRALPAAATVLLAIATFSATAVGTATGAGAQTTGSSTTTPVLTLAPTTTAPAPTTTAPKSGTTTRPGQTTTTTKSSKNGVPNVPVGGPPTTVAKPGTPPPKPAPPPDPGPILDQVDGDLAQLTAISYYKPAQALVARAQGQVTQAGAALLSVRQALDAAQAAQSRAGQANTTAGVKLKDLALAAYVGVGFTPSGYGQPVAATAGPAGPAGGTGSQDQPDHHRPPAANAAANLVTGMDVVDAHEMLMVVGQQARKGYDRTSSALHQAAVVTRAAQAAYQRQEAAVGAAEARLLQTQETLKLVTTAAITPGAAAATSIPDLLTAATKGTVSSIPTTTSTSTTTTTTLPDALQAAVQTPAGPTTINGAPPTSPTILGAPVLSQAELQAWWATLSRKPNLTVPVDQLIASYAKWGKKLGVRDDVAFAQSIIETGYFSFPSYGQLTDKDNNFAGIGACDTCAHGWSFPTADTGVQAQLELLHLYATDQPWPKDVANVIGATSVGGCCATWSKLAGTWASSTVYGISIMTVYDRMLQWVIPQRELAAGLIAPSSPAARGPELAPLPGAKGATGAKPTSPNTAPATTTGVAAASVQHG
ncbi:MAG TPA: glucosaminidase domain-containing protein [Acidimicrobiales bacterium]|nr:glucosaminidase domain-containing protein [Acidimicrobiales bacterium]